MKKLLKYFLSVLCVFAVSAPLVFGDLAKPDILDVQTTFKIGGVDKTKLVTTTATGTAFAKGVTSVTGSSTISSGLGTVAVVLVSLTTISDDVRYAAGTSSAANITLKVYGIGAGTATALSTTATNVEWFAIGTP